MKPLLNERLKQALESNGLKQTELAEKGNFDRGQLSSWLSGKYCPRPKNVTKLASLLCVSEAWLLGYDVPMEIISPDALMPDQPLESKDDSNFIKLFELYLLLNQTGKQKVLDYATDISEQIKYCVTNQ